MTQKESKKLEQLYEIYEQPMFRIAFAVLKNNELAEDAVSDAFVRIISRLSRIDDVNSPKKKNYVVKAIKNSSISIYRRKRSQYVKEIPMDEEAFQVADKTSNAEELIISSENESELNKMIEKISEPDRSILLLRCRDELSWREVAKILSLTEANVRKRFERLRKKLNENERRAEQ